MARQGHVTDLEGTCFIDHFLSFRCPFSLPTSPFHLTLSLEQISWLLHATCCLSDIYEDTYTMRVLPWTFLLRELHSCGLS